MRHVLLKAGVYFYQRRIPRDLFSFYPAKQRLIRRSLHTGNPREAGPRAVAEAMKDDANWNRLRRGELSTAQETTNAAEGLLRHLGLTPGEANTVGTSIGDEERRAAAFEAFDDHLKGVSEDYRQGREQQPVQASWDQLKSELDPVQRQRLWYLIRAGTTAQQLVERARIVMLAAAEWTNTKTASRIDVCVRAPGKVGA